MQPQELTFSVLVTREEYCQAAAQYRRSAGKRQGVVLYAAGGILTLLGAAGVLFGSAISLSVSASLCLMVIGVFLACYNGVFAPLFSSAAAAREYDENEDLRYAASYRFLDDAVEVKNGRMEGALPLSALSGWAETPTLFLMTFGREGRFAIPKRLMAPGQEEALRARLSGFLKQG
ncbi:MAG TPA: YcxB family protein [Firmicutes bacterium]|nr:YcxB family protein [Bacillota bacterium]